MKNYLSTLLLLWFFTTPLQAQAIDENIKDFGEYVVHYSVFNSTFIQPEIAQQYGLKRGADIGLINIAVHKKNGETRHAVKANLSGKTANLIQQQENLEFQIVEEGSAIYYIASFRFSTQEVLHFNLDIEPADGRSMSLKFTRTLYEK